MQTLGKRMSGVNKQSDMMFLAELFHRMVVHGAINTYTMMERHLLVARLGAIEVGVASLFQFFDGLTPFGGSAKNKNHSFAFLNMWVK